MITEKTLQKLQYPLVLEEVSKFAISSIAVRKVLDMNKSERHIRGGMATREKYLHQHS